MDKTTRDMSEYNDKMHQLYHNYLAHCVAISMVPAPFVLFQRAAEMQIARMVAAKINSPAMKDIASTLYVSQRQDEMERLPGMVERVCAQCGHKLWIDEKMAHLADQAKDIVCNHCAEEVSGISVPDFIKKNLQS